MRRRARAARDLQAPRQLRPDDELERLTEELVDRFGPLPDPARALVDSHRLRLKAKALGVVKVDSSAERTTLQIAKNPPFDAGALILMVQRDGKIRFAGPERIRIDRAAPKLEDRVALVSDFSARLKG